MRHLGRFHAATRRRRRSPDAPFERAESLEPSVLRSYSLAGTGSQVLTRTDGITSTVVADYDADGLSDLIVAPGRSILPPKPSATSFTSRR